MSYLRCVRGVNIKCFSLVAWLLLFNSEPSLCQVEFTGFFDLQLHQGDGVSNAVKYGQFELDLSSPLSDYATAEGAIAFNAEEGTFELGAGFVDFHLFGQNEEHPVRGEFLTHSGIVIGQFDVPFGIDYLYIPSPDRMLVTAPLLNEKTINSWNNFGFNLYGASERLDFTLFGVNGFNSGIALGGRVGVLPFQSADVGFSYVVDLENLSTKNLSVTGFDFKLGLGVNEIRAEYQIADGIIDGEQDSLSIDNSHGGYYLQVTNSLESVLELPVFAILRYGSWSSDLDRDSSSEKDNINRITLGLGYKVAKGAEIRGEYLSEKYEDAARENIFIIQTVANF